MPEHISTVSNFDTVVFAAMSKRSFYLREHIVKFILEQGYTPTCAFMMFSYFLLDTVNRHSLIDANNELIKRSDEVWVFGPISDGVATEIELAKALNRKIRYFIEESPKCSFSEVLAADAKKEAAR